MRWDKWAYRYGIDYNFSLLRTHITTKVRIFINQYESYLNDNNALHL